MSDRPSPPPGGWPPRPRDVVVAEQPALRAPRLLAALSGWPDAASVASRTVALLRDQLRAQRFAEIRSDDFYDLSSHRPTTTIRDGRVAALRYPASEFHYWRNPAVPEDLILFVGGEPQLQWRRYVAALLDLAQEQGVVAVYLLGGLYDNVPHTRPTRISGVSDDEGLRARLAELGVAFADYEGPSSLHTSLLAGCRARRLPAASLWGHAPGYAQVPWNPSVSLALVGLALRLLGLAEELLDLTETRTAARYLGDALDKLASQNPQVRSLIRRLERSYGPAAPEPAEGPAELQVSENVLQQLDEILRRQESGDDPPQPEV